MIITISGTPGTGKSTVSKYVAEKLDLHYYSTGEFMRDMAKKRRMSLLKFTKLAEKDKRIDTELDNRQIELGKQAEDFVIDSRLGFYFIPQSIKVFLKADDRIRAERIHKDKRKGERAKSIKKALDMIQKRQLSEQKRYSALYGINYLDTKYYDLVIDTTTLPINKVGDIVIEFVK